MNKVNNTKYTPAFGSLIHISQKAYRRAPLKKLYNIEQYIDSPWSIYDSKYFKEGYTDDASFCTIGVLKNDFGDAFMFHLRPNQDINYVYNNLEIAAENLKRQNRKLTGLLTGGNASYKPSVRMYEMLQEIFKILKIDFSALLGQRKPGKKFPDVPTTNLYYNGEQDKYVLSLVNAKNIDIHGMNYLKKYFSIVDIRKDDKIKFD